MVVTTVIPTLGRPTLWTRAVPSVMAQQDWRCIIVGDGVTIPPFDDERISVYRIPRPRYPADPLARWRVGGVRAFAYGLERVESEWFSYLADDDYYTGAHHAVLRRASAGADVVYGQARRPGATALYGEQWPPRWDDLPQGAYIMRTDTGMRPTETPGDMAWDRAWWDEAQRRGLRFARANGIVMMYCPAPESVGLHLG